MVKLAAQARHGYTFQALHAAIRKELQSAGFVNLSERLDTNPTRTFAACSFSFTQVPGTESIPRPEGHRLSVIVTDDMTGHFAPKAYLGYRLEERVGGFSVNLPVLAFDLWSKNSGGQETTIDVSEKLKEMAFASEVKVMLKDVYRRMVRLGGRTGWSFGRCVTALMEVTERQTSKFQLPGRLMTHVISDLWKAMGKDGTTDAWDVFVTFARRAQDYQLLYRMATIRMMADGLETVAV